MSDLTITEITTPIDDALGASVLVGFSYTPTDGISVVTGVAYRVATGEYITAAQLTSPLTVAGLSPGTATDIQLKITTDTELSVESDIRSVTTTTAPTITSINRAITDFSGLSYGGTITVTFTPPQHHGNIVNYMVSLTDVGRTHSDIILDPAQTAGPITLPFTYTDYIEVSVCAVTSTEPTHGQFSQAVWSPEALRITDVVAGDRKLKVLFDSPGWPQTIPISNYEYSVDGGTHFSALSPPHTTLDPITITGLTNGVLCDVVIRAVVAGISKGPASIGSAYWATGWPIYPTYGLPRKLMGVATIPPIEKVLEIAASAPTITRIAFPSLTSLSLSFTAASGYGRPITDYEYAIDSGSFVSVGHTDSPVVIENLTAGQLYTIKLRGVTVFGAGTETSIVVAQAAATAPTNVAFTNVGDGSIRVSLTPPYLFGSDNFDHYEYSLDSGAYTVTEYPIVIAGLTPDQEYSLRIRAVNQASYNGVSSSPLVVKSTLSATAPAITDITPGVLSLHVSFDPPENDSGAIITNYWYSIDGGRSYNPLASPSQSSPITVPVPLNWIPYPVSIRAFNSHGLGLPSNIVEGTAQSLPPAPTLQRLEWDNINKGIFIYFSITSWENISKFEYSLNNEAYMELSTWSDNPIIAFLGPIETLYVPYTIKVRSVNLMGPSPASNQISITPATSPGAPTITSVVSAEKSLVVNFSPPTDTGGVPLVNYGYYVLDSSGTVLAGPVLRDPSSITSPLKVPELTNGQEYIIRLYGVNPITAGATTDSQPTTPTSFPERPIVSNIDVSPTQLVVAFSPPADTGGLPITAYEYSVDNGYTFHPTSSSPSTITGLKKGTSYAVRIRAINSAGAGVASLKQTVTTQKEAQPPTIVLVPSNTVVTINITAPTDNGGAAVSSYNYKINDVLQLDTIPGDAITYQVTGLTNGQTYAITLASVNIAGVGTYCSPASSTPRTVPAAPTAVSADPHNSSTSIKFTAPVDNGGSPITNYSYSIDNGANYVLLSPADPAPTQILVSGLTNGTTYNIKLKAINIAGAGAASSMVSVVPLTVSSAPTISAVDVVSTSELSVVFTPPTDNGGSTITNYRYNLRSRVGNGAWSTTTTYTRSPASASSPIALTGLTKGRTYGVTLQAYNGVGYSPASPEVAAIPSTVPGLPTAVAASATGANGTITVNCTPPTDNGGAAITNYTYSTDNGATYTTRTPASATLPITITGLVNGTTYNVNLKAINQNGIGSPAAATSSVTPYGPPLAISGGLTVTSVDRGAVVGDSFNTGGGRTLRVNFTPPDNNGSAITNYAYSTDNGATYTTRTPASTTLPIDITGLTNGVAYLVNVKAINIAGAGAAAAQSVAGTPARTPDAPTLLSVTPGDQRIICSFSPPANNGGSAITGYIVHCVRYSGIPDIRPTVAGDLATNSATITGLINGETYGVWVVAANRMGNNDYAQSNQLYTSPLKTPQNIPQITGIVAGNAQLQVSFTIPAGDTISNFEYSTNGGVTFKPFNPIQTTSGSYTITTTSAGAASLVNAATYNVRLRATNAAGPGPSSTGITAIPYTVPGKPLNMQKVRLPAPNRDKAALSFTPPSSNGRPITNYEYSVNGGTTFTALNPSSTDTNPLVIPGLSMYTNYTVYVRAVNAAGAGEAGSTADVTITTSPRAPVVLSARLDYASSVIVEFIGFTTEVAGDLRPPGGETLTYEYSLSTSGSPGVYKNLTDLQSNAVSSELRPVDPDLPLGLQEWYSKFTVTSSGFNPLDNLSVYIRSRSVNFVSPVATYVVDTKSFPAAINSYSFVSSFKPGSSWADTTPAKQNLTVSFQAPNDNGASITGYHGEFFSDLPVNADWVFSEASGVYEYLTSIPATNQTMFTLTDLPLNCKIGGTVYASNSYGSSVRVYFSTACALPTPAPVITGVVNGGTSLEVYASLRNFYEEYMIDGVIPRYTGTPAVESWEYSLDAGNSWAAVTPENTHEQESSRYVASEWAADGTYLAIAQVQPTSAYSFHRLVIPAQENTKYVLALRVKSAGPTPTGGTSGIPGTFISISATNLSEKLVSLPSRSHNVRTLSTLSAVPAITSYTSRCAKRNATYSEIHTGTAAQLAAAVQPYLSEIITFTVPTSYAEDPSVYYAYSQDGGTSFDGVVSVGANQTSPVAISNTLSQISITVPPLNYGAAVRMYLSSKFFTTSSVVPLRKGVPQAPTIMDVAIGAAAISGSSADFDLVVAHTWPNHVGGQALTSIDYMLVDTTGPFNQTAPAWVSVSMKDITPKHLPAEDFVPEPSAEPGTSNFRPPIALADQPSLYYLTIPGQPGGGGGGDTYTIALRAVNKFGAGPSSSVVVARKAPKAPKIISVVPENTRVHLLVDKPAGCDAYIVYVNGVTHGYSLLPCFAADTSKDTQLNPLYPYPNRQRIIIESQPIAATYPYVSGSNNQALANGTNYEIYVVAVARIDIASGNVSFVNSANSNTVHATPAALTGGYEATNNYGAYFNLWAKSPTITSTTVDHNTGSVTVTYTPARPPVTPQAISVYGKETLAVTYQFEVRFAQTSTGSNGIFHADVPQGAMTLDYLASLPADSTFSFKLDNLIVGFEYYIGMRTYNGYAAPIGADGDVRYEDLLNNGHVRITIRPTPSKHAQLSNSNGLLGAGALSTSSVSYLSWGTIESLQGSTYGYKNNFTELTLSGGYPWTYTTWGGVFHDRVGEFSYGLWQYSPVPGQRDSSGGNTKTWYEITIDGGVNYINTEYDEAAIIGTGNSGQGLLRGGQVRGLTPGVPYDFGVRMNSNVAGPSESRLLGISSVYATKGAAPDYNVASLRMRLVAVARDLDSQNQPIFKLFVAGGGFSNGSTVYTCDYTIANNNSAYRFRNTANMLTDTVLTEFIENSFLVTEFVGRPSDSYTIGLISRNSTGATSDGYTYAGLKAPTQGILSLPTLSSGDLYAFLAGAGGFRLILDGAQGANNDTSAVSGVSIYPSAGETNQTEPNIVSYVYNINGGIAAPNDGQFAKLKLNYSNSTSLQPKMRDAIVLGLRTAGTNLLNLQGVSLTGRTTASASVNLTRASRYALIITGVLGINTKNWTLQVTYRDTNGSMKAFSGLQYIITAYSPRYGSGEGGYSWTTKDINGVLLTKLNQSLQDEYRKVSPDTRTQFNDTCTIPQPSVFDGATDIVCTVQLYDSVAGVYSNTYSFTINNTRGTPTITSYGTDSYNNLILFIQDPPNPLPSTSIYTGSWTNVSYLLNNTSSPKKAVTLTPSNIPGKYTAPHYDTYVDCLVSVTPLITVDWIEHSLPMSQSVEIAQAVCTGLNIPPAITSIRRYRRLVPAAPDGIEYGVDVNIAGASFEHGEVVTNYSYNLGLPGDATYTLLSPPQTTSPLTIRYSRLTSNKDFNLTIKAHTAQTESGISNVYVSPKPTLINWRYPGQQSAIFSNILAAYSSDGQSVVVTFAIDANEVDILNSSSKPEGYAYMLGKKPGEYITGRPIYGGGMTTGHKIDLNTCYGGGGTYDLQEQLTPGWVTIPENSITRTENSFGGSFTLDRATYAEALNAGGIYGALTVWNVLTSAGTDYKMFYIPIPTIDDIPFISNLIVTSPSEAYYPSNSVKLQVKYNDGGDRLIPGLTIKQFNCSINGADPITFTPQQPSAKNFISSDWLPGIIPGIDNHIYLSYTDTCGRTTQPSAFFIPALSPSAFITAYHCNFGCVYPTITRAGYTSPTVIHPTTPPPEGHVQVSLNNMVILPVWQHKDVTVFNDAHNSSPTPTRVISASLKPMPDGSRGVEIVFAPSTHADDVYYCFRYAEQAKECIGDALKSTVGTSPDGKFYEDYYSRTVYDAPIRYHTVKSNLNPEYFDFSNPLTYKCHCPIPSNSDLSLPQDVIYKTTRGNLTVTSQTLYDWLGVLGVHEEYRSDSVVKRVDLLPYPDLGVRSNVLRGKNPPDDWLRNGLGVESSKNWKAWAQSIVVDTWLLGNFLGGINAFTQKSEGSMADSENNTSLISINYTSGAVNMHDNVNPKRLGLFWYGSAADPSYLTKYFATGLRCLFSPGVWPRCVWDEQPGVTN